MEKQNIDKKHKPDIIRVMSLNKDYFIDFCKMSMFFYYTNNENKKNNIIAQSFAKAGASKGSFVRTGKPAIKRPLEATVKNKLERELGSDLPDVMIHSGGDYQGILTLLAAFALTEGKNVFIKEDAYKEGSLETDKILLHEMVHVLQNKNNVKIKSIDEKNKAEAEAEQAERDVYGDIWSEPIEIIEMDGKTYKLTEKQKKTIIHKTVDGIIEWIEKERVLLSEEEYLKLLVVIQDFRDSPVLDTPKTSHEKFKLEIEEALRKRLY